MHNIQICASRRCYVPEFIAVGQRLHSIRLRFTQGRRTEETDMYMRIEVHRESQHFYEIRARKLEIRNNV